MQCRSTLVARAGDADYARAFDVTGLPTNMDEAVALYNADPLHKAFEMWAVGLVPMLPQEKKSGDKGIDGIRDYPVGGAKPLRVVAQVKGGGVGAPLIQNLKGAMQTHNADVGLFISLEPIKKTMVQEASLYPPFVMPFTGAKVPGLQLRTIEELLDGKRFDLPNAKLPSQAVAIAKAAHKQADLGI